MHTPSRLKSQVESQVGSPEMAPPRRSRSHSQSTRAISPPEELSVPPLIAPPNDTFYALVDGLLWLGGAVILRLAIARLLLQSPEFWLPGVAILATPALMAIMLATLVPRWSWILGYRLILIMFGLLLGGRL
jgi:hypothetical protein